MVFMNKYLTSIARFFRRLRAFFPSKLPTGVTELSAWVQDIQDLYGLPDYPATTFALASMIVSLPPTKSGWSQFYKSKRYFGLCALKSMSNQVASTIMQELHAQKQAALKAEQEKAAAEAKAAQEAAQLTVVPNQSAEATAPTEVASNVVPIQN